MVAVLIMAGYPRVPKPMKEDEISLKHNAEDGLIGEAKSSEVSG